ETWNPPHTSALLRWLGVGPSGVGRLMVLDAVLTYLALALAAAAAFRAGNARSRGTPLRVLAVALVLLNPVIAVYVGIIWKDVVFATAMNVAVALGLVACVAGPRASFAWALASTVLLAFGMKVRQQGLFMAPVLVLLPMVAVVLGRGVPRLRALGRVAAIAVVFVVALGAFGVLVARTVTQDDKLGNQVGFNGLMQYDIAGMVALSDTPTDRLPIPMSDELRAQVRSVYSPDRGDFLWYSPSVTNWLHTPGYAGVRRMWWTMVRAEPGTYLQHRIAVFRSILDVDGVKACLPLHVGIDGDNERLRRLGFAPGLDRNDQLIYNKMQRVIYWPIYRHFFYAAALVIVALLLVATPMHRRLRIGALVVVVATALLYASYLPTSIACDFRYLYPATCLVSMLWIVWIAAARGRPALRHVPRWRSGA
ncbi:MAG TPA: hypothetical protein VIG54_09545, partial [Lysobacter sp.]